MRLIKELRLAFVLIIINVGISIMIGLLLDSVVPKETKDYLIKANQLFPQIAHKSTSEIDKWSKSK